MSLERRGATAGFLLSRLAQLDEPFVSTVCVAELMAGALLAATTPQREAREAFLGDVLQSFPVLPFGMDEARTHAELYVALRRSGQPIGERDLMIAATAMANGHGVMTHNAREFRRVDGLRVLEFPEPGR